MRKRDSFKSVLQGPPEVIPWEKRERASPVEIRRAFTYLTTRNKRVAQAEALLTKVSALPAEERHPDAIQNLKDRVENARDWLHHSTDVLDSLVKFALARIDGTLQRESRRPLGRANKKWHTTLRYYAAVLEEFKLAKSAAAGHSGSSDALAALIHRSKAVVKFYSNRSNREYDDAEQEAMLGILKAAEAFDPAHSNLARFNTYAQWKVRRATEARTNAVLKPGKTYNAEGKVVTRFSVDAFTDDDNPDSNHPATEDQEGGLSTDLTAALATLTPDERVIVQHHLNEKMSIRALSEKIGISAQRLSSKIEDIKVRLRGALAGHWGG